jgi:hypothetical protein
VEGSKGSKGWRALEWFCACAAVHALCGSFCSAGSRQVAGRYHWCCEVSGLTWCSEACRVVQTLLQLAVFPHLSCLNTGLMLSEWCARRLARILRTFMRHGKAIQQSWPLSAHRVHTWSVGVTCAGVVVHV